MGTIKLTYNDTRGHPASGRALPTNASLDDWGFMFVLAISLWSGWLPMYCHAAFENPRLKFHVWNPESDDAIISCCDSQLPRQRRGC